MEANKLWANFQGVCWSGMFSLDFFNTICQQRPFSNGQLSFRSGGRAVGQQVL
jgi:hypothetical protein